MRLPQAVAQLARNEGNFETHKLEPGFTFLVIALIKIYLKLLVLYIIILPMGTSTYIHDNSKF